MMPGFSIPIPEPKGPKRPRPDEAAEVTPGAAGSGQDAMKVLKQIQRKIDDMNVNVGEGDFSTPLLFAVARQILVQDRRTSELEGILLTQWELDTPNDITPGAQQWARNHQAFSRTRKGLPKGSPKIGSVGMWKFYGMFDAMIAKVGPENVESQGPKRQILSLVTTEGQLNNEKIRQLWAIVRVCRVTEAKRKSYVVLHFTPEGAEVAKFVTSVLTSIGANQILDAPPPTPAIRDLRKVLAEMGYWGPIKPREEEEEAL